MADKKPKRKLKKIETVRERSQKSDSAKKPRRIKRAVSTAGKPIKAASKLTGRKYYLPIKLPDNRIGRFLAKEKQLMPKYFREAWHELKLVQWPSRRETIKLSLAVFIFALVFGGLVWVVDYGLDNLFRKVLIN